MVIVMLGVGTKAGVMEKGCRVEIGLCPPHVPTDMEGPAKGLREGGTKTWEDASYID